MKKVLILILSILSLIFSSCFSIPKETSYTNIPDESLEYRIDLDDITVNLNLIRDEELSNQIRDIFSSMLCEEINRETYDSKLKLELQVNQRSYYKGINQFNSIYLNYRLTDEKNAVILNNCYFNRTTDSIDSSKIQYKLVSKVVKDIKKVIVQNRK